MHQDARKAFKMHVLLAANGSKISPFALTASTLPRSSLDANNGLLEPSMAGVHFTPFRFITGHCAAARIWVRNGIFLLFRCVRGNVVTVPRLDLRWVLRFVGGASDD